MTVVQTALWWMVLVSCPASHATATNHRSVGTPYKRLAVRNSTTAALGSSSLAHSPSTPGTSPSAWTRPDVLPPHVSADAASDTRFTTVETSSFEGTASFAPTDSSNGEVSGPGAWASDTRTLDDTSRAHNTSLARPPLTTPPSSLASQHNSTNLAFPTFPLNTTSNVTATQGRYSNSSTIALSSSITTPHPTTTEDYCTTSSSGAFVTVIEYSIIHTWTITWYGDPADYTPPFPPISIPRACTPTTTTSATDSLPTAVPSGSTVPWWVWISDGSAIRGMEPTLTFVTTDKNPAVVFPTSLPPDYGGSPDPKGNVHSAAYPNEAESSDVPGYGNEATTNQNVRSAPITDAPPVTVIVKPSLVVIDDQTFTNDPARPTSTVVVNRNTFTINPTQVVGVGATVSRPPSKSAALSPPPTKTTIGGISVDVEGSSVIIDKTSFTIGPRPTTVVVKGQTITLGPGAIIFPGQTLTIPAARETTQVVVGAELITATGSNKAIIEGRTITYGPGSSTVTEVIDGDTILIGPSGIIVHGETYGGSNVASTEIQFAVVGGVTITQIGSTMVVVQGVTYILDPLTSGQTKTTTVLGGETITIGPGGVAIDTWTLDSPSALTTTITPRNGAGRMPTATATVANTNKENGGPSLASKQPLWGLTACIAISVGILGSQFL